MFYSLTSVITVSIVHALEVLFRYKIKSPVTPREYHLSLRVYTRLLAPGDTQRGYVVTSCRRRDVTPSQTTGFILATLGICHTVAAHVTAPWYKVLANMDTMTAWCVHSENASFKLEVSSFCVANVIEIYIWISISCLVTFKSYDEKLCIIYYKFIYRTNIFCTLTKWYASGFIYIL